MQMCDKLMDHSKEMEGNTKTHGRRDRGRQERDRKDNSRRE